MKISKKLKKTPENVPKIMIIWYTVPRDIIILHMCTKKLRLHHAQFLKYGAWMDGQMDGQTDGKSDT